MYNIDYIKLFDKKYLKIIIKKLKKKEANNL